jgi:hypothetical protein
VGNNTSNGSGQQKLVERRVSHPAATRLGTRIACVREPRITRAASLVGLAAVFGLLLAAVTAPWNAWGQTKGSKTVKRAAAPKYSASDIKGVYFEDIFDGKVLAGERPANFGAAVAGGGKTAGGSVAVAGGGGSEGGGSGAGWSKLISAATIEDEVKGLKLQVDKTVTTPTEFAGKGYKEARRNFMMLAMLFAIIGEYDGEVRWKQHAPTARELFARTSANAKVGTQQVYNEAKLRKTDLEELLGGNLSAKGSGEAKFTWGTVCDRSPLMQRLEMGLEPRLQQWTASKSEFMGKKDEILREAELFVVMGHVLMQEGMDDAEDAEYKTFCEMLKKAALDVVDAVKLGNDEQARKAVGTISKSCADCHDKYR